MAKWSKHSQNQITYIQRKILSIFRRLPSFGISLLIRHLASLTYCHKFLFCLWVFIVEYLLSFCLLFQFLLHWLFFEFYVLLFLFLDQSLIVCNRCKPVLHVDDLGLFQSCIGFFLSSCLRLVANKMEEREKEIAFEAYGLCCFPLCVYETLVSSKSRFF